MHRGTNCLYINPNPSPYHKPLSRPNLIWSQAGNKIELYYKCRIQSSAYCLWPCCNELDTVLHNSVEGFDFEISIYSEFIFMHFSFISESLNKCDTSFQRYHGEKLYIDASMYIGTYRQPQNITVPAHRVRHNFFVTYINSDTWHQLYNLLHFDTLINLISILKQMTQVTTSNQIWEYLWNCHFVGPNISLYVVISTKTLLQDNSNKAEDIMLTNGLLSKRNFKNPVYARVSENKKTFSWTNYITIFCSNRYIFY